MPSSLYYSNLDGDWYVSSRNIFGGGSTTTYGGDKYAELMIGRIAAYTNEMVSNAIYKIIWYDNCIDNNWLSSVGFGGSNLGWSSTSKDYMEELRRGDGCYSDNTGFEEWNTANLEYNLNTTQRWYYDDGIKYWYPGFYNCIMNNNCSILNHLGHSSWNTPFGLNNWYYINNTKPFFGWSQGCLAGRFTSGTSGSEQLQCTSRDSHAFGLVLNTGYGYGSTGSTCGSSQRQHKVFWDYYFSNTTNQDKWQLGRAYIYQKNTISNFAPNRMTLTYVWFGSTLFADPAQKLKIVSQNTQVVELSIDNNGYNYLIYPGVNTTLKDISLDIPLDNGESVLVNVSGVWKVWITGWSEDYMNYDVNTNDDICVKVATNKTWVIEC